MVQPGKKRGGGRKTGRAAGGVARMASLSSEQRQQLARAAAAARWQEPSGASKHLSRMMNRRQEALLNKMQKELSALQAEREMINHRIHGLTQAINSLGAQSPHGGE
jgi:chorismate mutase